jgi:hypothetical protein
VTGFIFLAKLENWLWAALYKSKRETATQRLFFSPIV